MKHCEILIIGAGAAGISAAKSAYSAGCENILLVEHKGYLGGVLPQCFHHGFGNEMTGSAYTEMLLETFPSAVQCMLHTTVLSIHADKTAVLSSAYTGEQRISFDQVVLATGCREIPAGALNITGTRPLGVYTAGQMQEMMNLYGRIPKSPVVVLGGGDLGLIMASQIAQAGGSVTIIEQNTQCGGLERNQKDIRALSVPVIYENTIKELHGEHTLRSVTLKNGDVLPCKTLLVAVGLCPNQELLDSIERKDWMHLCGNCNRVHSMIESVVYEGTKAGIAAWEQLRGAK